MIPVFAAVEWLSLTDPTVRIVASICTAAFAIVGSCFMAANQRTEKYVTLLQVSGWTAVDQGLLLRKRFNNFRDFLQFF